MFETDHPVYSELQSIGREITQKVKPKAIVVLSAHWQSEYPSSLSRDGKGKSVVEINSSESEPLLYDFYGFPRHYYAQKFPNRGSTAVARRVGEVLTTFGNNGGEKGGSRGYKVKETERGLDHGVFVPFKIMFDPLVNPLGDIPIVQVSLLEDDEFGQDALAHIEFGRALEKLREERIVIVTSGMAVHNLRHLRMMMMSGTRKPMGYAESFDEALRAAVEEPKPGKERDEKMVGLLRREDARLAHPTFEHLLPVHVAVGAAGIDEGKRLWTMAEGCFSWAQFRFGEV